ncbi:MAG: hypothetical protein II840_01305 [Kiritimatiellae bacterium]|nr:hypothetical protein [Kiritimatiellia bacterium]
MKTIVSIFVAAMCTLDTFAALSPAIPFLAVTGKPTEADLARKVAALKEDGFDQFLVYARSGLQYKYMGEEWLNCVDALCREADARGMKVWLYDEYNWPSGTCKGRVPNECDDFRHAELAVYRNDDGTFRWQKVLAPAGWVNVLDEGAMKRFVELTHEVYEKRLAKWFEKKTILGIFTDEPGHPTAIGFDGEPLVHFACWREMENEYRAMTGGDFKKDVEACLAGKGSDAVWEAYAALKGRRFRTNYFDRIDSWCRKTGVLSTGHMISENSVDCSCIYNGDPLVALKGESLPGIDETSSRASADAEWLTLSVARHAIDRRGNGGAAELFACGPNDMSPARLRQMAWLAALFGIDRYFLSMQVMDHKGMVEKHGYFSPFQEGQPWHRETPVLLDEMRRAAAIAGRKDVVRHVAVRYPQKTVAARAYIADAQSPGLCDLLGAFNCMQLTPELIEEGEDTDLPFVFAFDLSDEAAVARWGALREQRTGWRKTQEEAVKMVWKATRKGVRYYELDGSPARDLVVREFSDGTSVALDVRNGADRRLVAERHGVQVECTIPSRGVAVLRREEFPSRMANDSERSWMPESKSFDYELDRDNVIRLPFDTNRVARFTLSEPLELKLVLREFTMSYAVTASGRPVDFETPPKGEKVIRHDAVPYSFELDGRMLEAQTSTTALPVEYNPLYRETRTLTLPAGEHAVRIVTGEADRNFYLPAAFLAGRIARCGEAIGRLPKTLGLGSLADYGLGDYCGEVTYKVGKVTPATDSIRVLTGGLFTRVKWNGEDFGVRAWAPFDWKLPSAEPGTLEVKIYTPVVNIMGDVNRKGSDWDMRFWQPPRDIGYDAGLFGIVKETSKDVGTKP